MQALGLTVDGDAGPVGFAEGRAPDGRRCTVRMRLDERLAWPWRGPGVARVAEQRHPDGRVLLSVDSQTARGLRVEARGYGVQIVSPDGREISQVAGGERPEVRPLLMLCARALPIAAVLQGLEVLHSSAVVMDGRVLAFVAASGTGKSSIAAHLVAAGAEFMTDDVLAVEGADEGIRAHPGPRLTKISSAERNAIGGRGRARLGPLLGQVEGEYVTAPVAGPGAGPLAGIYVMRRAGSDPPQLRGIAPDPLLVHAMTYIFDIESAERRRRHLELAGALAARVPFYELRLPEQGTAARAASLISAHARGS